MFDTLHYEQRTVFRILDANGQRMCAFCSGIVRIFEHNLFVIYETAVKYRKIHDIQMVIQNKAHSTLPANKTYQKSMNFAFF